MLSQTFDVSRGTLAQLLLLALSAGREADFSDRLKVYQHKFDLLGNSPSPTSYELEQVFFEELYQFLAFNRHKITVGDGDGVALNSLTNLLERGGDEQGGRLGIYPLHLILPLLAVIDTTNRLANTIRAVCDHRDMARHHQDDTEYVALLDIDITQLVEAAKASVKDLPQMGSLYKALLNLQPNVSMRIAIWPEYFKAQQPTKL